MAIAEAIDGEYNLITGRNGTYKVTKIEMFTSRGGVVHIDGYGKRGGIIKGGFMVTERMATEVCVKFLEEKGFVITPPIEEKKMRFCDECGAMMTESEYKNQKGLCSICIDQIQ